MKNFLKTFERLFVYYLASMGIALLFGVLCNIPFKLLLDNNFKVFKLKTFLFSELLLLILLIVVIYIIGRAVYILGPTDYLAHYILHLANPSMINGKIMLNQYCMILMFCAYVFLYAPIIIAEYIGVKKNNNQFKKQFL